jgi:hypothetical protein
MGGMLQSSLIDFVFSYHDFWHLYSVLYVVCTMQNLMLSSLLDFPATRSKRLRSNDSDSSYASQLSWTSNLSCCKVLQAKMNCAQLEVNLYL